MISTLINLLQESLTLPPLQKKENTSLHNWKWVGTNIELQVFMEKIDGKDTADDYLFIRQVDIRDFKAHCEVANEIPKSGFCEWFEGLSWFDKQVEAESYADRWITEIKADYAAWLTKKAI